MTEQAKKGEQTFAKEKDRLFNFIRRFVPTREDAEDILQDVFYQFISYADIELIEKVNGWLFKTARNKIIDKNRKKKTESFDDRVSEELDSEETFTVGDLLLRIDFSPEDLFLKDEFNEKFEAALNELPLEQCDVFIMNEVDGLSFKEISEITGLTVNTLLSRKHYAVKQLKKKLNKYLSE
jgi:RNA polymerase sigma factor (sigma-70 family)